MLFEQAATDLARLVGVAKRDVEDSHHYAAAFSGSAGKLCCFFSR
jgi:hypothetical protein